MKKRRDEKLQYNIDRKTAKNISIIIRQNGCKEHLVGKEILPSNQSQIIQPTKLAYLTLRKSLKSKEKLVERLKKNNLEP